MMKREQHSFDARVDKILHMMIHSIYTNHDIFLRELISNSSDACDKLRYEALHDESLYGGDSDLKIAVSADPDKKNVSVIDNGVGMTAEEMKDNLGTIASSGTEKFFTELEEGKGDVNLIGQFGVGFYSSFMVADKVEVFSRKAGAKKVHKWSSDGVSGYTLEEVKEGEEGYLEGHGTNVILHIVEKHAGLLDKYRLKHIISTYSEHISFPISLTVGDETEVVNSGTAIWLKDKDSISEEQYNEFYQHIAHMPGEPFMTLHTKAEGALEYISLLYIPSTKPFDLFHPDRKCKVKLYVKRVFISEDADLVPGYMRFLRGLIDSSDLPLNISRESLQDNPMIAKIRRSVVSKVLKQLKHKAEEDKEAYASFWKNFGEVLKEGLCEPGISEKEDILEICRFTTTKGEMRSISEYTDDMVEGQDQIFYITGEKLESVRNSPQIEGFKKRGIEVLLLTDNVDDFWVHVINQYKNREIKSVASQVDLDAIKPLDEKDKPKADAGKEDEGGAQKASNKDIVAFCKETLGETVKDVIVSTKLVDSPACITNPEGGMSIRMEKYLIEQKQLNSMSSKIFEINPDHPIWNKVSACIAADDTKQAKDLTLLTFDQACIVAGLDVQDPVAFTDRINNIILQKVS